MFLVEYMLLYVFDDEYFIWKLYELSGLCEYGFIHETYRFPSISRVR